jgi:hypothetical protein
LGAVGGARCFAESNGHPEQTKAKYLNERVERLKKNYNKPSDNYCLMFFQKVIVFFIELISNAFDLVDGNFGFKYLRLPLKERICKTIKYSAIAAAMIAWAVLAVTYNLREDDLHVLVIIISLGTSFYLGLKLSEVNGQIFLLNMFWVYLPVLGWLVLLFLAFSAPEFDGGSQGPPHIFQPDCPILKQSKFNNIERGQMETKKDLYQKALEELESGVCIKALWAKCSEESGGDLIETKKMYLQKRIGFWQSDKPTCVCINRRAEPIESEKEILPEQNQEKLEEKAVTNKLDILKAILYPPIITLGFVIAQVYRESPSDIGLFGILGLILAAWLSYQALECLSQATNQSVYLVVFCMMIPIIGWIAIVAMTIYQYIQQPKKADVS